MNWRCSRISKHWNKTVGDRNVYVKKLWWSKSGAGFVVLCRFLFSGVFNIIITHFFRFSFIFGTIFFGFFFLFVRILLIYFWLNGSWPQRIWPVIISYYKYFFDTNWCSMFNVWNVVMVFTVNYVIVIYHLDLVICHRTIMKLFQINKSPN